MKIVLAVGGLCLEDMTNAAAGRYLQQHLYQHTGQIGSGLVPEWNKEQDHVEMRAKDR